MPNFPAACLNPDGRFFNPKPQVSVLNTGNGGRCVVLDDALAHPQGVREWAATQTFVAPAGYPYPGHVCEVPAAMKARVSDAFIQHARAPLRARRLLDVNTRLSVVDTPAAQLLPVQWLCHRDRLPDQAGALLFAASVLYLFDDPGLGGTSFYAPRQSPAATAQLIADSQQLTAHDFAARYGLQPAYMAGSNAFFERTAQVPARWNRLIVYEGSLFHSADVDPARLQPSPLTGRLTLNSFFTCRRALH